MKNKKSIITSGNKQPFFTEIESKQHQHIVSFGYLQLLYISDICKIERPNDDERNKEIKND